MESGFDGAIVGKMMVRVNESRPPFLLTGREQLHRFFIHLERSLV